MGIDDVGCGGHRPVGFDTRRTPTFIPTVSVGFHRPIVARLRRAEQRRPGWGQVSLE